MTARAGSIVGVIVSVGLLARAASSNPPPVPPAASAAVAAAEAPRGMVAFVAGAACPPGWQVSTLAAGRVLVGTDRAEAVGRVVGEPLGAEEDRAHVHALGVANLTLPARAIAGADGGNHNGAASGAQPLTGTTGAASSGLPFVQLPACVSP